jgi:Cu(I)/Ag(I) efflux system membrane fusion protein
MNMPLEPVYADESSAGPEVSIDPRVAQNLGIRVAKAEKAALQARLHAAGSVAFDERLTAVVQARVDGYATRLRVKAPLESVRRGQALVDIVAPEWLAAETEYLALLDASTDRARSVRDAARQRLIVLGVPEIEIRKIERDRKTPAATTVYSPAGGVVTELSVREGAAFAAGAPLFRINGLDTIWIDARLPEVQAGMLAPGTTAEVRASAWPGASFTGRVIALLPELDPATRTIPVRVEVRNAERRLAPGMFVTLDFRMPSSEPQLAVPTEAVIVTGTRNVVIVAVQGGFDVREVVTGAEADGKTAIISGLSEGEAVVLSGQFLIDSEASLKSAVTRLETANPARDSAP